MKKIFFAVSLLLSPVSHANDLAINLIKNIEKCKTTSYNDGGGHKTIGYGFKNYHSSSMSCKAAEKILSKKIYEIKLFLDKEIPEKLSREQEAALISLAYNIGIPEFSNSTLLKFVKKGNFKSASSQFITWTFIKKKYSKGLATRRKIEQNLFNQGK